MTVVNPKSISGITSITTASGSDNLLTIHTSDASNTERFRIDSTGATKIVTGIVTTLTATTGVATHFTADKISLPDSSDGSLCIGIGSDLKLNHNGTDSYITEVGGGDLYIQGSDIIIRDAGTNEKHIEMTQNGAVDLYHNGTKKLETGTNGVVVTGQIYGNSGMIVGAAGGDSALELYSDAGGQDADKVRIRQTHVGNSFLIESYASGAYQSILKGTDARTIELHYQGTKMLETISTGTNIPDGKFAKFGNSNDMSMGHNTYNYITYTGADFLLTGDATNQIKLMPKSDEAAIICKPNAEVELFHDGTLQCETSANGLAFPNGKGIDFSATANGGANTISELLDDYEEGEWNPAFGNGLVASAYESNGQRGSFTKIGNFVHCTGILHLATASTQSGSVITITGLPFTAGDYSNIGAPSGGMQYFYQDGFYNSNGFTGVVSDTGTEMLLYRADTGAQLTGTSVNGGREIRFQVWYHTPT